MLKLAGMLVIFLVGLWALDKWSPRDDSDSLNSRSGMTIHRDQLTGCEYLSRFGGVTPRLDSDGKQICRRSSTQQTKRKEKVA